MSQKKIQKSKRPGSSPGTLDFVGEQKTERVRITLFDYDKEHCEKRELETLEPAFPYKETPSVTWINLYGIHEVRILERIGAHFQLHPLVLEDILNTHQRPKVEDYADQYLFIVLKLFRYAKAGMQLESDQISFILGPNYVLTFQEREASYFAPIRERLERKESRLRQSGADYLLYRLLDTIVDNYFILIEQIGERLEVLEERLLDEASQESLHELHRWKREIILIRKSIWPLREIISGLRREASSLISESTEVFLRDVYDHTIQVIDTVESYRDVVSGLFDIYMSGISHRMNEVMKVLTIIATIFIPITFVAGIYGMNFDPASSPWNMPELSWYLGYPTALGLMALIAFGMFLYFKRKDWL